MNLQAIAVNTTYRDVQSIILNRARKLSGRTGIDIDECLEAGDDAFMVAYESYDPSWGTAFSTWLWWQMRGKFRSLINEKKKEPRLETQGMNADLMITLRTPVDGYGSILAELSEDAQCVAEIIRDVPLELMETLCSFEPAKIRRWLVKELRGIGCPVSQIIRVFSELREAVGG